MITSINFNALCCTFFPILHKRASSQCFVLLYIEVYIHVRTMCSSLFPHESANYMHLCSYNVWPMLSAYLAAVGRTCMKSSPYNGLMGLCVCLLT